jgi:fructose-1,6-bisphosphatase
MSYTISNSEQHTYKCKTKKDKNKLKKAAKNKYVYVHDENIRVGTKLYVKEKYYSTVVSMTHRIYMLQNEYKPMSIPDPFLKETFDKKGFKIVNE